MRINHSNIEINSKVIFDSEVDMIEGQKGIFKILLYTSDYIKTYECNE